MYSHAKTDLVLCSLMVTMIQMVHLSNLPTSKSTSPPLEFPKFPTSDIKTYAFLQSHSWRILQTNPIPECLFISENPKDQVLLDTTATIWRADINGLRNKGILVTAMRMKTSCYMNFWGSPYGDILEDYAVSLNSDNDLNKLFELTKEKLADTDFGKLKEGNIQEISVQDSIYNCKWLSTNELVSYRLLLHDVSVLWNPDGSLIEPQLNNECLRFHGSCQLSEKSWIIFGHGNDLAQSKCELDSILTIPGFVTITNDKQNPILHKFISSEKTSIFSIEISKSSFLPFCKIKESPLVVSQEGIILSFTTHSGTDLLTTLFGKSAVLDIIPLVKKTKKTRWVRNSQKDYNLLAFPENQRDLWLQEKLSWGISNLEWTTYNLTIEEKNNFVKLQHELCKVKSAMIRGFSAMMDINSYPYLSLIFDTPAIKVQWVDGRQVFKLGVPSSIISDFSEWKKCNSSYIIEFRILSSQGSSFGLLEAHKGFIIEIFPQDLPNTIQFCKNSTSSQHIVPLINGSFWDFENNKVIRIPNGESPILLDPFVHFNFPSLVPQDSGLLKELEITSSSINELSVRSRDAQQSWRDLISKDFSQSNDWFFHHLLSSINSILMTLLIPVIGIILIYICCCSSVTKDVRKSLWARAY